MACTTTNEHNEQLGGIHLWQTGCDTICATTVINHTACLFHTRLPSSCYRQVSLTALVYTGEAGLSGDTVICPSKGQVRHCIMRSLPSDITSAQETYCTQRRLRLVMKLAWGQEHPTIYINRVERGTPVLITERKRNIGEKYRCHWHGVSFLQSFIP